MDELKPCPFCGSEVHRVGGDDESTTHDIECTGCSYTFYDWSDGDTWWNTRPGEAAAEQRGYERALDDVMKKIISHDNQYSSGCWNDAAHMVIDMKSDYLRQEGKNGKQI